MHVKNQSLPYGSCAILNNMSIVLLEKNCFQQAMESFREVQSVVQRRKLLDGIENILARVSNPESFFPEACERIVYTTITIGNLKSSTDIYDAFRVSKERGGTNDIVLATIQLDETAPDINILRDDRLLSIVVEYNLSVANHAYAIGLREKGRFLTSTNYCEAARRRLEAGEVAMDQLLDVARKHSENATDLRHLLLVQFLILLELHSLSPTDCEEEVRIRQKLAICDQRSNLLFALQHASQNVNRVRRRSSSHEHGPLRTIAPQA